MRSFTCVSVVVYVARKLRPCPSYSRRRDRINLVLWRSLDKGGGGYMPGISWGMPCTQCAHSAKFWMSTNTRTLFLAHLTSFWFHAGVFLQR